MNTSWTRILKVVELVLGAIVRGVPAVETLSSRIGLGAGDEKLQAVLDLVDAEMQAADVAIPSSGPGVVRVEAAQRAVISAVVELHNAIAAAHASDGA